MNYAGLQVPDITAPRLERARRIRDEEWEVWRDQLIRLFLDDGLSRKDVVDAMAKYHHFLIK